MIVTVKDDFDKQSGTDLPMFSRAGKTTVSQYIAFSQAAMNKHEEEDWLKQNPGGEIADYREMKRQKRLKNNDGGLSSLQEQREKLLKNDDQVTIKEIEDYFSDIRNKRKEEKQRAEDEKRMKKEAAKQQNTRMDKKYFLQVSKQCTATFKASTRDYRDNILSKLDHMGNGAPEVGKYNPKHGTLRKHVPDTMMLLESGENGKLNRQFFAQTDPSQFMVCEKVLRTLEEGNFSQQAAQNAQIHQNHCDRGQDPNSSTFNESAAQGRSAHHHENGANNHGGENENGNGNSPKGDKGNNESDENDGGSPKSLKSPEELESEVYMKRSRQKPWDPEIFRKLSYPNIAVSPRFHMVIDRPIEKEDGRKMFKQPMNSPQYLVRRGGVPDMPITPKVLKAPNYNKYQGRSDITMDGFMRQSYRLDKHRFFESDLSPRSGTAGSNTHRHSMFSLALNSSPKKQGIPDPFQDKQLQMSQPVPLSWTQSKNSMKIPKMIERVPGENFIGKYETQAMYDLPTCIGELMYTIPKFKKMAGRERRVHGTLLRNMNALVKAGPEDAAPRDSSRPFNISYERMMTGFHKLGHVKKQAIGFDMGKSKARDMNMYMTTEAYKNVLYENYRLEVEQTFDAERKPFTAQPGKRGLNNNNHRRGDSMRNSFKL